MYSSQGLLIFKNTMVEILGESEHHLGMDVDKFH
jgi:hypothetical protein